MSARVFKFVVALTMSCCGFGQQAQKGNNATATFRQQLLQRVATDEAALRQAEAAHATELVLARIYWRLGMSYTEAAEWGRSEAALDRSVSLFRGVAGEDGELAEALDSLSVLHLGMGHLRQSEKEEQEALHLREKTGNRLLIARSWESLAALALHQHKYERARDLALRATAEFATDPQAQVFDEASAHYALAMAYCALKDCSSAVPVLKQALDDARAKLQPRDFPIGFGEFLLGYAYWKSGDMTNAGRQMQMGVVALNEQLGWGHPTYLTALKLYAKYLHEAGNVEAAAGVERQIQQSEAVVDVGALQSAQGAFGFDGLR